MSDVAVAEAAEVEPQVDEAVETEAMPPQEKAKPAPQAAKPEAQPTPAEPKEYWPNDWRERVAEHYSAGDRRAYDRELRRLQRFQDPSGIYGMGRELEAKFSQGGLAKIPGKNSSEEEVNAFYTQLGVPDTPDKYIDQLELTDGVTLGENDIETANSFIEQMHKAKATPAQVSAALNWYWSEKENAANAMLEQDDADFGHAGDSLKEIHGPALNRKLNALPALFAEMPGGTDKENPSSVIYRMLNARTPDGILIGNDPDIVNAMIQWNAAINPVSTVTDYGDAAGRTIEDELAEIRQLMRDDRRAYNQNTAIQARYRELLEAQSSRNAR